VDVDASIGFSLNCHLIGINFRVVYLLFIVLK
jgi:hypothetical protein